MTPDDVEARLRAVLCRGLGYAGSEAATRTLRERSRADA